MVEVEAQRCAATLPVGETWGSKGKGGRSGGGSPPKGARSMSAHLHAPNDQSFEIFYGAEDRGYRFGRRGAPRFTLAGARAEPLATLTSRKMLFRFRCQAADMQKGPASEEAGPVIPMDQSPLRRDQINTKLSSPSTLTSDA
jgi:hypothetical protein